MCIKSCEQARRNSLNMADNDINEESFGVGGGGHGVGGGGGGGGAGGGGMNQNIQQTLTNGNPTGITEYHHHPMNNNGNMTSHGNSTATNAAAASSSGAERIGEVHSLNDDHHNSIDLNDDDIADGVEYESDGDMTASLPKALIVTGLDSAIFDDIDCKEEFENLFKAFDNSVNVHYLKCFRRARVVFSTSLLAATARIHLHETELGGKTLKCYFAQPTKCLGSQPLLQPPKPARQHLISPPASPPVGWEPSLETEPVINYDLLAAVAALSPGEAHELHPPTENQPGVVVHICEEPEEFKDLAKPKIVQTMCPDRVK